MKKIILWSTIVMLSCRAEPKKEFHVLTTHKDLTGFFGTEKKDHAFYDSSAINALDTLCIKVLASIRTKKLIEDKGGKPVTELMSVDLTNEAGASLLDSIPESIIKEKLSKWKIDEEYWNELRE